MAEETPVGIELLWKKIVGVANRETVSFTVVIAIALYMFLDMRDQASQSRMQQAESATQSRLQQAEQSQQGRLQQAELVKELRDRETRAWDTRAKDKLESWKHSEEMGGRVDKLIVTQDKLTQSIEDLVKSMKPKAKTPNP